MISQVFYGDRVIPENTGACMLYKKRQENPVKGYKGPSPVTSRLFYYFLHCAEHKKK